MSRARPPLLWTLATTTGRPSGSRSAVMESMLNAASGAPPGPTERYTRIPTRFTTLTPPDEAGVDEADSAQITA